MDHLNFFRCRFTNCIRSFRNGFYPPYVYGITPALNFVPLELVELAFDHTIEELENIADLFDLDDAISERLNEVASYFQRSYINSETMRRNSREHSFFWTQSKEAASDLIRAKIAKEEWHFGATALFLV